MIYQKKRRGDGFQSWHQDLVGNGTIAATIVVNIDSIAAEDESYQIEQIHERHRLMEEVSLNTGSNSEHELELVGEDRLPKKPASGQRSVKVHRSAFKFSAAEKAPRLGSVEEYKEKKGDDQESDAGRGPSD